MNGFLTKCFFAVFIATTWVQAELKVQITIVCFRSARFDNRAIYDTTPPGDNRTMTRRNGSHSRNWYVNVFFNKVFFAMFIATTWVHAELKVQIKKITIVCFRSARFDNRAIYDTTYNPLQRLSFTKLVSTLHNDLGARRVESPNYTELKKDGRCRQKATRWKNFPL